MNRTETLKILAILRAAYPHSFRDVDVDTTVALWMRMFAGDSYKDVDAAICSLISTRTAGYSPTIGEVKERLYELRTSSELPEDAAWALVSKACRNGLYGYRAEYDKLPPDVQRAVGAPEQLKAWAAMDEDTVQSVVASNFMRNYRARSARAKEICMLPHDIRGVIEGVADRLQVSAGESNGSNLAVARGPR